MQIEILMIKDSIIMPDSFVGLSSNKKGCTKTMMTWQWVLVIIPRQYFDAHSCVLVWCLPIRLSIVRGQKYGAFDTSYKVAADFENLLRIIYVGNIKTKYIPKDFVTMRTGGASTAGLSSRTQIMKDHLRALKTNGIYSNVFLLSLRYIYKVYELVRR